MAVKASRVTVGTTAQRLDVATEADKTSNSTFASYRGDGQTVAVQHDGPASIYWGGSDVTATTGTELKPGVPWTFDLLPGDDLYAIVASGTVVVQVGQVGV